MIEVKVIEKVEGKPEYKTIVGLVGGREVIAINNHVGDDRFEFRVVSSSILPSDTWSASDFVECYNSAFAKLETVLIQLTLDLLVGGDRVCD